MKMLNTNRLTGKVNLQSLKSVKELSVAIVLCILLLFASLISPAFFSGANLKTTAVGFSCNGIIAIAMTLALVSGGFDLSVGSVLGLSSISVVVLSNSGVPVGAACLLGCLVGILCGLVNGFLIGYVQLNAFITTLGMQQMARGLVYVLTNGGSVGLKSKAGVDTFRFLGSGTIGGFPVLVIIFLLFAVLGDIIVRKSSIARNVFFVGSNEKTAMLSGINTKFVKMMVYTMTGTLSGIAGVLTLSRFGTATASTGSGVEMTVISAAVVGGVSLSGGKGTVAGSIIGIILLSIITNILVIMNVSVHWQNFITGMILILAIIFDAVSNRKRR
jgi:ribose transport system permease protein